MEIVVHSQTRRRNRTFSNRIEQNAGNQLHSGRRHALIIGPSRNTQATQAVEVNAPIQYSASKDHLFIEDAEGKVHKLALIKTTRKEQSHE